MVEDKGFVISVFHRLFSNFKLSASSEDISMDSDAAVINECINKLQGLLGNNGNSSQTASNAHKGSSSQPSALSIPAFDSNFAKCLDKANAVCN